MKQRQNEDDSNEKILLLIEVSRRDKFDDILKLPSTEGILLNDREGIVITTVKEMPDIGKLATIVEYEELPEIYTLNEISPIEASGALKYINGKNLKLDGTGVLIGIIDTGIDYLNDEFTREDDSSRVFRIWDQSLPVNRTIYGLNYGAEYTEEDINKAIELKKNNGDPYSIVPTKDTIGHGTMMASILGARGKQPEVMGMAPNCEFVVVKLEEASKEKLTEAYIEAKVPSYSALNIILALRYITNIASEFKKPVTIYIPLGSNLGGHQGATIIEESINMYAGFNGVIIVTNTGNQGNTETHTEGNINQNNKQKDISLKVAPQQKKLPIQIWIRQGSVAELSVISPSGEIIDKLNPKTATNRVIKFFYEETEMLINYIYPEKRTGDALINIRASNLKEGVWTFRLTGDIVAASDYYAWIPQRELIEADTKFLQASSNTTLTVPSTANRIISVAFYNQDRQSIESASGRGYPVSEIIKPDIAAGGINALVTMNNGGTRTISGASVAGAIVAGGCALILQWAVVLNNDNDINYKKMRSYIISGSMKRAGDIYPNMEWGFGMFNIEGVFGVIKKVVGVRNTNNEGEEYYVNGLFIRKPKNINMN